MIGKVLRGSNVRSLLHYLYGPGRANEHTDPHLVAGFGDPAELEPARRPSGSHDLRRLAGLLAQSLAALAGPGYAKPVWHCSVRAAPGDRIMSDAEWADIATEILHHTGLAPRGDEAGVRWVAVRHASDHIHIVATLARQDGTRPRVWNDFYRVRESCQAAEERLGLHTTPPGDRTAARRPSRAETEQAARRGWHEPPRVALRRHVCGAAAGARTEHEFFARLTAAGVLVRKRYSTLDPGQVTGYAVGLPHHLSRDGGVIWYGGGKLASDLTLPKLRTRWAPTAPEHAMAAGMSAPAVRAVLRHAVTDAAHQARNETEFFALLRSAGVQVRPRFSDITPDQVTGYAVTLPGHVGDDGQPRWYGGGRLSDELTLPRLRRQWGTGLPPSPGLYGPAGTRPGTFRFAKSERDAIYRHAARQAAIGAEHIRRSALADPTAAADAACAAADALHIAAQAMDNQALRRAVNAYDRAARAPFGRVPRHTGTGDRLRATARVLALIGGSSGETPLAAAALAANLVALALAVAELRQAQRHAAQSAAARTAAEHLHAASRQERSQILTFLWAGAATAARSANAGYTASHDFLVSPLHGQPQPPQEPASPASVRRVRPPKRAGPAR
jgi:hypothetical protein